MNELRWNQPELWPWLLLLPVLWLLLRWALAARRRRAEAYGAPLKERVPTPGGRATVLTLVAGLLILCWMDPLYGEEQVVVERRGLDLIFCLDTSRSMLARDVEPSRLERALLDIRAVLPELTGGDRVALVAFAGVARIVAPLTHDVDVFGQLLDGVDTGAVPIGGSDLAAALRQALAIAERDELATTVVVMLTDGEDLIGAGRQAASELAEAGALLHTVGYGSTRGSKITLTEGGAETFLKDDAGSEVVTALDADGLRAMAEATGGEFLRADAMPLPLLQLQKKRLEPMLKRAYESGEEAAGKTRYQWVLLPALLLLLWEIATCGGRRR